MAESRSREIRGRIADQAHKLISHFYGLRAHLSASNFPGAARAIPSSVYWTYSGQSATSPP